MKKALITGFTGMVGSHLNLLLTKKIGKSIDMQMAKSIRQC